MAVKTFDASKARQYQGWTNHPFLHKSGPMPWAACSVLEMSKIDKLILCSGETGRDPETDREPLGWEEQRADVGKVVGGIKEQTTAAWTRIKETLDGVGARMEDIVFVRYYLRDPNDRWDMWDATHEFFKKHAPLCTEDARPATLLENIILDLPKMLIEIEVIAVIPKK